jgi:alkaline phosphatase D
MTAGLDATAAAARADQAAQGKIDVNYLNQALGANSELAVPLNTVTTFGISYLALGKQALFGQIGSRYLVIQPTYDVWAAYRVSLDAQADNPYGVAQSQWLDDKLAAESDATWKVMGSSTSQTSLKVNLSGLTSAVGGAIPDSTLYLDCDGWDGFPVGRQALHDKLSAKNVVVVSGDIHASYVADFDADTNGNRLVELTGPAVSSQSFAGELHSEAALVPALVPFLKTVDMLIKALDGASGFLTGSNPTLRYTNSTSNGVVVVTVDGTNLTGKYALLDGTEALTDNTGSPAMVATDVVRVTVQVPKTNGKNGAVMVTT